MGFYVIKIIVTTTLIVVISEIAKRSSAAGAVLASIPVVSAMAIIWLYIETKDVEKVSALAVNVTWFILPSLVLFISLPLLLRQGFNFYLSMTLSVALTIISYFLMTALLHHFGIDL